MDWPYEQSRPGERVKPAGFWKDPRTVAILRCFKQGCLSEDMATRILRTLPANHQPKSDVRWYVDHYDREGWPPSE